MPGSILKWAICSAGKISNDFALCLNILPESEHKIVAVAARDIEKAKKFAKEHSIPKAYGSYEDIAKDVDVDVVYIGSIHTQHYPLSKMMLEAGKHVLCEKPLCVTLKETKSLINIAKSTDRFLMEGIWSRFFPAYQKVRELIDSKVIGEVRHVQAVFGEYSPVLVPRIREKDQAGGALLDRGLYPVQFAQFVYNERPIEQQSFGTLHEETGVDTSCHIFLRYSNNRTAVLGTSILSSLNNEAVVCGTNGTIKVCFPLWSPTKVEVSVNYSKPEVFEFSLPEKSSYGKFNFRNSQGFVYEAADVRKVIVKGEKESSVVSHDMSLQIAEIMDKARHQIGYDLPQDKLSY